MKMIIKKERKKNTIPFMGIEPTYQSASDWESIVLLTMLERMLLFNGRSYDKYILSRSITQKSSAFRTVCLDFGQ